MTWRLEGCAAKTSAGVGGSGSSRGHLACMPTWVQNGLPEIVRMTFPPVASWMLAVSGVSSSVWSPVVDGESETCLSNRCGGSKKNRLRSQPAANGDPAAKAHGSRGEQGAPPQGRSKENGGWGAGDSGRL